MKSGRNIENAKGTYVVISVLEIEKNIRIGKIGTFCFQPGFYVYSGSAFGPGGAMARIRHHLRTARKPHWHMDYFRKEADICEVWICFDQKALEHVFAEIFLEMKGSSTPVRGFGCSDCRCISHLFHFESPPDPEEFEMMLRKRVSGPGYRISLFINPRGNCHENNHRTVSNQNDGAYLLYHP